MNSLNAEYSPHLPTVLVLSGHDPTGGAGLVADAESVAACGGWAMTIPTALTVQDLRDVHSLHPLPASGIREAAKALASLPIAAIKIGLIADLEGLDAVVDVIKRRPGIPVVADPVLRAGGGASLATQELIDGYRQQLLPMIDILTPNRGELARLAGADYQDDTERCVSLMHQGCQAVLVTGTDDPEPGKARDTVSHTLHTPDSDRQWTWPRLPASYHGSGCTLASALAARLAAGETLVQACEQAQVFAWQALAHGWDPGHGQSLPRRLWKMPTPRFSPDEVKV